MGEIRSLAGVTKAYPPALAERDKEPVLTFSLYPPGAMWGTVQHHRLVQT